jgi:hypothetical protein
VTSPRVQRRSAAIATLVVLAALVTGYILLNTNAGGSRRSETASIHPQSSGGPTSTTSVTPAYLPAGVSLMSNRGSDSAAASTSAATYSQYAIAGSANADTVSGVTLNKENDTDLSLHPSTEIDISFLPGATTEPPPLVPPQGSGYSLTNISIAGNPATLLSAGTGPGTERIDWLDSSGYHVILCDRLVTDQGLSGVPASELVKMADSLY